MFSIIITLQNNGTSTLIIRPFFRGTGSIAKKKLVEYDVTVRLKELNLKRQTVRAQ